MGFVRRDKTLYAFYDLDLCPLSYDFLVFLMLAEMERVRLSCRRIHLVIVPGRDKGFRNTRAKEKNPLGLENFRWRMRNIVLPSCALLPSVAGTSVCISRSEARTFLSRGFIFPSQYTLKKPVKSLYVIDILKQVKNGSPVPTFKATSPALFFIDQWIRENAHGRKVITINLKESTYRQMRNSNLQAWAAFAKSLNPSEFLPVIIRDNETALGVTPKELDGLIIFNEAVWNLELRAALYEKSYLNFFINHGPAGLCLFNANTRFLMFKVLTPQYRSTTKEHYENYIGLKEGEQYSITTPFQRLVWQEDTLENIQKAFYEMHDLIQKDGSCLSHNHV